MTNSPHHGSRLPGRVPRPARPRHAGPSNHGQRTRRSTELTFWLYFPYQGLRWEFRCPSAVLTAPGTWSVHGRCATDERRGTDLLAGRDRARRVKAGVRTRSGKRAGGGPRTGRVPGRGEATPAHAPARPLVNGRRGGTASTRPVGTAPGTGAESADTRLTARLRRGCDPGSAARPAASLAIFRLPRVRSGGPGRALACVRTGTVHAQKGTSGMTSLVSQRSTRQPPRTITRQVTRLPRPAGTPADPGRAIAAGQRRNVPAGGDRGL
jgi:hypothetical protein